MRAVLQNGVMVPIDPVPADWPEGVEVSVERADPREDVDIDSWLREWRSLPGLGPDDWKRVQTALAEERRLAKEQARRELGLDG